MTLTKLSCQSTKPLANRRPVVSVKRLPQQKRPKLLIARKSRSVRRFFLAAMSLGAYALLLSNMKIVTDTFTLGGWYAVLPVGTAFLFSFVHGAFASNFLSVLGLEPKKS